VSDRAEIDDLASLKGRLELLPSRCPPTATVVGPGVKQAEEQIPIICRNIDDAVRALTTGRDPNGNRITESEVADGLTKFVQATQDPGFVGLMSLALSMDGVSELMRAIDELAGIAARLRRSAPPSASKPEAAAPATGPAVTLWFESEAAVRRFLTDLEDPETRQRALPEAVGTAIRDPNSDTSEFVKAILGAEAGQELTLSSSARQNADRGGYDVTLVLGSPAAAEAEEPVARERAERAKAEELAAQASTQPVGGLLVGGGDDLMARLVSQRASCPGCGASVEFEQGVKLAWDTIGTQDQVVMCKECKSIYEVEIAPGRMRLTSDVTARYQP
jgi:hypothetical protein